MTKSVDLGEGCSDSIDAKNNIVYWVLCDYIFGFEWLGGEMEYSSMSISTVNSFLECSRFSHFFYGWVNIANCLKGNVIICYDKLIYMLGTY